MKRIIFFVIAAVFTLSSTLTFASEKDKPAKTETEAIPVKTETKLSDEEIDRITKRVEEIRSMDKSELTAEEMGELKSELKIMKKDVKQAGGTVYIGGASLILIIILIILLV
ncbi:MAG: hypothetical protein LC649_10425 [Bacteroidales bacterium]|nr:hypothetical protein [Bacteroidales bacterium]